MTSLPVFDIPDCLSSLDLARQDQTPDLPWLGESQRVPEVFFAALVQHAARTGPPLRSRLGAAIHLYDDAIGRRAASRHPACVSFDPANGWQTLSYAELDARASACAAAWAAAGLVAGDVVALALSFGPEWLIALGAAWRLGLVVSVLGDLGEDALCHRLDALGPARVVFERDVTPPARFAKLALEVSASGAFYGVVPHVYPPEAPCGSLFSPLRAPLVPVLLGAERALTGALADAVFAYRLNAGDALALPGFELRQHQPAAALAALVAGATFVHVPKREWLARPQLLRERPIAVLGLSPALVGALRRTPLGPLPGLRHWWRGVDEPIDWVGWKDALDKNGLDKVQASNLLVDAAAGGCVLFSARRPGALHSLVLPVAGRAYELADALAGAPALGAAGVFVALPGDPKKDGWFLLVARGGEYLYGSTLLPRRAGRVFSNSEVAACARGVDGVICAEIVPVPTGESGGRWAFVLVAFIGGRLLATSSPAAAQQAGLMLADRVSRSVRERLGDDFVPDRVEMLPLYPHLEGEKLDSSWCARQYFAGFFQRKQEHPVFLRLTALRANLLGE